MQELKTIHHFRNLEPKTKVIKVEGGEQQSYVLIGLHPIFEKDTIIVCRTTFPLEVEAFQINGSDKQVWLTGEYNREQVILLRASQLRTAAERLIQRIES